MEVVEIFLDLGTQTQLKIVQNQHISCKLIFFFFFRNTPHLNFTKNLGIPPSIAHNIKGFGEFGEISAYEAMQKFNND